MGVKKYLKCQQKFTSDLDLQSVKSPKERKSKDKKE